MMNSKQLIAGIFTLLVTSASHAAPISLWDNEGWTQFADDEGVQNGGYVDPGYGGQKFDAEYLYYKLEGSVISFGIQAGFDLIDGKVRYSNKNYYTGDLALSFDNDASNYEYAVDFGLLTRDYHGGDIVEADNNGDGKDDAGLYRVSSWNNDIIYNDSAPFAMDGGTFVKGLESNRSGQDGVSYFRIVSFDLAGLGFGNQLELDAHWTMSCGNDVLEGHVSAEVSEPNTIPMLALGVLALAAMRRNKNA
ncbi:hypothetical protein [Alkalimarinus sediminis]|uniref:PEP-CTERM protein-sorting domain-containing protein n=1 Tax=Alkalimarinus sediminis TaxID=1632866 RepID=A0A9E8KNK8_9ALTE|nr:hypothetical protein [Alkalimarinus sediminis]UZW74453.1 hypothetical protein NNL22_15720 [Alkalimarinus sediminis]